MNRWIASQLALPSIDGLRDYGTGSWEGGDCVCAETSSRNCPVHAVPCDHVPGLGDGAERWDASETHERPFRTGRSYTGQRDIPRDVCGKCGARRVDRQIGLEADPESWAAELVAVFAECRRVLRPAGSLWIECGDSYAANRTYQVPDQKYLSAGKELYGCFAQTQGTTSPATTTNAPPAERSASHRVPDGMKPKDLIGQPFLLAFALRAAGWYWRGCYPWSKVNAMPESAKDRCTTAHSYVLHFAKSGERTYWTHRDGRLVGDRPAPDYRWVNQTTGEERTIETLGDEWRRINLWRGYDYFFDGDAIAEPAAWERWGDQTVPKYEGTATATGWMQPKTKAELLGKAGGSNAFAHKRAENLGDGRVGLGPTDEACPPQKHPRSVWTIPTRGFPGAHFATWPEALAERIILAGCPRRVCGTCGKPSERLTEAEYVKSPVHGAGSVVGRHYETGANNFDGAGMPRVNKQVTTVGWSDCGHGNYKSGVILDPFGGSGTTAVVARRLGRHAILIELNEEYARMAADRVANWWKSPTREREPDPAQTSLLAEAEG